MNYSAHVIPFLVRPLPDGSLLAVSQSGDHTFFTSEELDALRASPNSLPLARQADLKSRFFLTSHSKAAGMHRLLASRQAARQETLLRGTSLHIVVPTLACGHSCRYCQVSRAMDDTRHTMTTPDLLAACDRIFESPSNTLTVEFQGGDPLVRFDLVRQAIERIVEINKTKQRNVRFVVASTLHQLDEEMCGFFRDHEVFLSTSIDGPAWLHNKNRPTPSRDAYERTVAGLDLARSRLGATAVSALMTTTRESLGHVVEIVDEYVKLGLTDIFLRPLSIYGFAKRNERFLGYSEQDFQGFYANGLERVFHWNRQGSALREVYASILLNKILSPFDNGYVDLQSPGAAGESVLVYNYDGYIYPSDEARMLAETGDCSLRLGPIQDPIDQIRLSHSYASIRNASAVSALQDCARCVYNKFCAPNPVDSQSQYGRLDAPVEMTNHCQRHKWLFDTMFVYVREADPFLLDLLYSWAIKR